MKILVSFYSRTGNTKKLGRAIAGILKADSEEIIDKKSRSNIIGWLGAGKDAFFKKPTEVSYRKKPAQYDLVIVGTPVWVGTATPAVRKYLSENKFKKIAFFCTFGGHMSKTFADMEKLSKKPVAVLSVKDKKMDFSAEHIKKFCSSLK